METLINESIELLKNIPLSVASKILSIDIDFEDDKIELFCNDKTSSYFVLEYIKLNDLNSTNRWGQDRVVSSYASYK